MNETATRVAPRSVAVPSSERRIGGLDGLRGIASIWVLAFHLWPEVVPGGWLGVGLFFTLSGYLITGLLDAEIAATDRVRLGRFLARRMRRLLPAAHATIAATLALVAITHPRSLRAVGVDALNAALSVFNWHTSLDDGGYAQIFAAAPEPLAHFWSLAIEEQFYLVFAVAVAVFRRPGRVVAAMAVVGLAGVWLWWGSVDAYVATPVRALEIAAGAGLAVAQRRFGVVRRLFQPPSDVSPLQRVAWVALTGGAVALTALSVARLDASDSLVFRGAPQMMALCWVVLVIAAVRAGPLARLMSWAPLRWLGLRSYAVYLFHWPLIELTDWHPAIVISATLVLAELSFHRLEMPVRRGTGRLALPLMGAAALAVVVIAVAVIVAAPARGVAERAGGADELTPVESAASVPVVTVLGDSVALHIADGLREWGLAGGRMAVVDNSRVGCSPVGTPGSGWQYVRDRIDGDAHALGFVDDGPCRDDLIAEGSSAVLIVDHGAVLLDHRGGSGDWTSILDPALASDVLDSYRGLVEQARSVGARVVFTTAPSLLAAPDEDPAKHPQTDPRRAAAYNSLVRGLVEELDATGDVATVGLIDTAGALDQYAYEGVYGRSDGMHLDYDRAEAFAAGVLGPALLALLAG